MTEQKPSLLLSLPAELLHQILTHLPPTDLAIVSRTCRRLKSHSESDLLWHQLFQSNIPGVQVLSPPRHTSFKELYAAHHPYWFLTKHKIWFSDSPHTGKLSIARYDPRRGCIEAYRLVAERGAHTFDVWDWLPDVIIHTFSPRVCLHLDSPVVRIGPGQRGTGDYESSFSQELLMETGGVASQGIFSSFFLARPLPLIAQTPSTAVWPPRTLPAKERVRNESQDLFSSIGHRPQKLAQVSETTFRIRRWMEFGSLPIPVGVRMGEDVTTWSTLAPEVYTPTKEKPFQGIWVGDYSGHGCEFLVVMQPDKPSITMPKPVSLASFYDSLQAETPWPVEEEIDFGEFADELQAQAGGSNESDGEGQEGDAQGHSNAHDSQNSHDGFETSAAGPSTTNGSTPPRHHTPHAASHYNGRLEAVKLTGDPNVPRGEYTFIADDIGDSGLIRIAEEPMFKGARVVRSVGHIAARGYQNGMSKISLHLTSLYLSLRTPSPLLYYLLRFDSRALFVVSGAATTSPAANRTFALVRKRE
ncbi:MAG: hypothetical protein M1819_005213 [Sarea resinae]|nr:MAG: hypothetical protein M1819_005213 [Sarea resinae]